MLSTPWTQRKNRYDFVIIGSGYGGAIAAAGPGAGNLNPKPPVCILERGKERQPGEFPETLADAIGEARSSANPPDKRIQALKQHRLNQGCHLRDVRHRL